MPTMEVSSAFKLYKRETGEAESNRSDNPLTRYKEFINGPYSDEYLAKFSEVSFYQIVRYVQH